MTMSEKNQKFSKVYSEKQTQYYTCLVDEKFDFFAIFQKMLTTETTTKMLENNELIEIGTDSSALRNTTEKLEVPNGASDSDLATNDEFYKVLIGICGLLILGLLIITVIFLIPLLVFYIYTFVSNWHLFS